MDDVGNDGTSMGKYLASPRCDHPDGLSSSGMAVRQPNKEIPVLIHVLKDCGEVVLSE
jgi:hypothetical protein